MGAIAEAAVRLEHVASEDREFVLAQPIEVEVDLADGFWTFNHPGTGLNSYGVTRAEAEANFGNDLAYCWDNFAMAADTELLDDARELKQQLLVLVRSVNPR